MQDGLHTTFSTAAVIGESPFERSSQPGGQVDDPAIPAGASGWQHAAPSTSGLPPLPTDRWGTSSRAGPSTLAGLSPRGLLAGAAGLTERGWDPGRSSFPRRSSGAAPEAELASVRQRVRAVLAKMPSDLQLAMLSSPARQELLTRHGIVLGAADSAAESAVS